MLTLRLHLQQARRATKASSVCAPTPATSASAQESPRPLIRSVELSQSAGSSADSDSGSQPAAPVTPEPVNEHHNHYHHHHQQQQRCASAPPGDVRRESVVRTNTTFLGATSYTSIFTEGLGNDAAVAADLEAPTLQDVVTVSHDRIARGCQILSFLRDRVMVLRFISRWYELGEGTGGICIEFIMREWLMKLSQHHGGVLAEQNPDKMRRLSELIWCNTREPSTCNAQTTAIEWARLATGQNLRWEVIGLMALGVGLCANCLDPSDQFLSEHKVTRQALSRKMVEVAEACISFCRECESLGDLFIWLLLEYAGLIAVLKGDGSYACYVASGEVNNAAVAMGMHQGIAGRGADKAPFFLVELRKKVFTGIYYMEISVAALLGRPPRLSHRHCIVEAPLDLTDGQLVLQGRELDEALAELDASGFNKIGRIQRSTWLRTCLGFAKRREDILDLALGHYSREEVLQRAEAIQAQSEGHWASLPDFLRCTRNEVIDLRSLGPLQALFRTVGRQASRANELLLQRVLIRKTGASSEKLIAVAQAIFADIMQITQRHDIASMFQMDFAALLVAHGLRSGAIIAVELLKQEQLPTYPERPLLPRSQTIQDLAVFAARLGTIDPSDGTFAMCNQGRKAITRILDKILAPGPPSACHCQQQQQQQQQHPQQQYPLKQVQQGDPGQQMNLDASNSSHHAAPPHDSGTLGGAVDVMAGGGIGMDANPGFSQDDSFLQWLETMDWEKGDSWRADTWNGL